MSLSAVGPPSDAIAAQPAGVLSRPDGTLTVMADGGSHEFATLDAVARRLAGLLLSGGTALRDPGGGSELEFEATVKVARLPGWRPAPEAWAVDGGQALVADARCLQVVVARAARVCFRAGRTAVEDQGPLRAYMLGADQQAEAGLARRLGAPEGAAVDLNLLRDAAEWEAVAACVEEAADGAVVLVDGDLVPDWRLPAAMVTGVLDRASERGVTVAGVTKHSSLARGGVPLVGQLELEAEERLGPRSRWWASVARTRDGSGWPPLRVVVARFDADARFAFRVDLPAAVDPEAALAAIAAVSNDAAFPGYPYPLSVADRLAACPGWLRAEARLLLDAALEEAGVPASVRERAFDDRHRLMERA